jgi:ubiquinone/menaquinone biosynthesis C-methylase UbiE
MKDDDANELDAMGVDHERIYDYRFRDVDRAARQAVWNELAVFIWQRMGRPYRVLDPAGGWGEFINAVPAGERWFIDMVDYPARTLDPAVKMVIGDILDVDLPDAYFDGIFVSNVLEHLPTPDAVAQMLRRLRDALVPGGALAILGPNFKYAMREYYDCADHLLPLTDVSLEEHLYGTGFQIRESIPRFLPYSFRSRFPASAALTRAYLRAPFAWRFGGKQFLIVATAP